MKEEPIIDIEIKTVAFRFGYMIYYVHIPEEKNQAKKKFKNDCIFFFFFQFLFFRILTNIRYSFE